MAIIRYANTEPGADIADARLPCKLLVVPGIAEAVAVIVPVVAAAAVPVLLMADPVADMEADIDADPAVAVAGPDAPIVIIPPFPPA